MKILFYIYSLGQRGGMEHVTIAKANALVQLPECEVGIAIADSKGFPENIIQPLSTDVRVFDLNTPFLDHPAKSPIGFLGKMNSLRKSLQHTIDTWHPDIVISTGQIDRYVFPFLKQTSPEYVKIREHHFASTYKLIEDIALNGKAGWLRRIAYRFESHILFRFFDFNAFLTHEDYENNAPKGDVRFGYVHNPSTATSNHATSAPRDKIILAAGRMTLQKDFASLIRIWAKVQHKNGWILRILGEGELHEELSELVATLGLGQEVQLPGFSTDVAAEMSRASLFAATSKWEGLPLVQVEAMACGCPVISYRTPYGPADVIRNGVDGILITLGDEQKFADTLQHLINHPDEIKRMSSKASERAEHFSINRITNIWMEKYESLLSHKRNPKHK